METGIKYEKKGEWGGLSLEERGHGLWRFEQWSQVQGNVSGRVVILQAPEWWHAGDEADMDSRVYNPIASKADMLIYHGREVRCIRRGHKVQ